MFGLNAAYLIRRMFACGSLDGNKSVAPLSAGIIRLTAPPHLLSPQNSTHGLRSEKAKWAVLPCTSALNSALSTLGRLWPDCKLRLDGVREVTPWRRLMLKC